METNSAMHMMLLISIKTNRANIHQRLLYTLQIATDILSVDSKTILNQKMFVYLAFLHQNDFSIFLINYIRYQPSTLNYCKTKIFERFSRTSSWIVLRYPFEKLEKTRKELIYSILRFSNLLGSSIVRYITFSEIN